jgi:hypothetical protein
MQREGREVQGRREETETYAGDDGTLLGVRDVAKDVLQGGVETIPDVAAEDAVSGGADGGSDRVDDLVEGLVKSLTGGLRAQKNERLAGALKRERRAARRKPHCRGEGEEEKGERRTPATMARFELATFPRMFFNAVLRPLPTLPPRIPSSEAPTGVATESTTSSRVWSRP